MASHSTTTNLEHSMHARRIRLVHATPAALAAAVSLALAPAAHAVTFDLEDGARVIWNTTASAGTSVRNESPDPRLIHPYNAALYGIGGAVGGNSDHNFEKNKAFSTPFKIVTDVEYKRGEFGALVRAKAWYDYTLEEKGVRH